MKGALKLLLASTLAALLAAGLAACGGGSDSTTTATTAQGSTATTPSGAGQGKSAKSGGPQGKAAKGGGSGEGGSSGSSAGGSAHFHTKGGDNSIQGFGSEAEGSELDQAAAALHGYLDARAAEEWAKACSHVAAALSKSLQQLAPAAKQGKGKSGGCPQLLAAMSAGMPPSLRRELTQADVGALRIEGERAFLLYHGAHRTNYFMPMARESGQWKVAAIAASALP